MRNPLLFMVFFPTLVYSHTWPKKIVDNSFEEARCVFAIDIDGDGDIDILGAGDVTIAWWENTTGTGNE